MSDLSVGIYKEVWRAIERVDEQAALSYLKKAPNAASLLPKSADPPLLQAAVTKEMFLVVQELLRIGADPNGADESGITALHTIRNSDSAWLIGILCSFGANPNLRDSTGWTPLHHNVVRDQPQLISALISAGANPELAVGQNQLSPLHYAILMQRVSCAHALLAGGANPNASDLVGMTPLISLATTEHEELVSLLLKYGAEVDQRFPEDGMTALMTAARCGNANVITLLRNAGASISLTDFFGRKAIDFADEVSDPLQRDNVIKSLIRGN